MTAKNRHRRKKTQNPQKRAAPHEGRAAEAMTIAWTATVTTLVICEVMWLLAVLYAYAEDAPQTENVRRLAGLAQFCALVLAVVALILMAIVYRVRRVRPPRGYVAFAGIAAGIPFVTAVWYAMQ